MRHNLKIYLVLITLVTFFISCSDDDNVEPLFDRPVDERISMQLNSYKEILVAPEFGWKIAYQPTDGLGFFNIYIKFNTDGTTVISSDVKDGINDLPSTYRIAANQFPELVLESFTVFHDIFEANRFRLGGEFEFLFEDVQADRIILKSKTDPQEKSEIILERASADDKVIIESLRGLDERITDGFGTDLFFRSIIINNSSGQELVSGSFSYDFESRVATIRYLGDQNNIITEVVPIKLTNDGFDFVEPFSIRGQEIQKFAYNEMNNVFVSNDGGVESIVTHSNNPGLIFFPEVNNFGTRNGFEFYIYFDSSSGNFLRQTSQSFLDLGINSGFNRIDIRFNDLNFGGINYFQFSMNDGATVFAIFDNQKIENERIIFSLTGLISDPQDADVSGLTDILTLLVDPNGWYIERTNESLFSANPSFLLTSALAPDFRFSVYGI